jgi:hypothetical protein
MKEEKPKYNTKVEQEVALNSLLSGGKRSDPQGDSHEKYGFCD